MSIWYMCNVSVIVLKNLCNISSQHRNELVANNEVNVRQINYNYS